jgi:GNAT superfamily N-acetyltransferase
MSIQEARRIITQLIEDHNVVDAPTAYYALYHDPNRSTIATSVRASGRPQGFVGRFQTGHDLFRPLVSLHCRTPEVAADLMAELLTPGRPYLVFVNQQQAANLGGSFQLEVERRLHIYYLDTRLFRPSVNVMVVERAVPDGPPRFEIRSGGLMAVSGINWMSPGFAEIYVYTEPLARKRGWGRAVVTACAEWVLRSGRLPLYLVEADNEDSIQLAQSVGFVDSTASQVYAEGVYLGHPAQQEVHPAENQAFSEGANGGNNPAS